MVVNGCKRTDKVLAALSAVTGVCLIGLAAYRLVPPGGLHAANDDRASCDVIDATHIAAAVTIEARERPLIIERVPGLECLVTDSQAVEALCASLPQWNPPTVALLLHEFRLWGSAASFSDRMVGKHWSGAATARILLSDSLCRDRTVANGDSYLLESPFGIRVVRQGSADAVGSRGEAHHGQLLQVLGEAAVPLSTPVVAESGQRGTIADILRDAAMRFTFAGEPEFMATALALWLPPAREWTDRFGTTHSFDDLMAELLSAPYGRGSCGGCHRPYAVTLILRCDEQQPILSTESRRRALQWLEQLSKLLQRSQRPDGGWDLSWPGGNDCDSIWRDDLMDRITIVGHSLEWIALAPTSVRPSHDAVKRAAAAVTADIYALPDMRLRSIKSLLPCSHAARALCLLRGVSPYCIWSEYRRSGRIRLGQERGWTQAKERGKN